MCKTNSDTHLNFFSFNIFRTPCRSYESLSKLGALLVYTYLSTWHLTQPVRFSRISLEAVRRKFKDFSETERILNCSQKGCYSDLPSCTFTANIRILERYRYRFSEPFSSFSQSFSKRLFYDTYGVFFHTFQGADGSHSHNFILIRRF